MLKNGVCFTWGAQNKCGSEEPNGCGRTEYQRASLSKCIGNCLLIGQRKSQSILKFWMKGQLNPLAISFGRHSDPLRQVTYQPDSADPVEIGKRHVGRPRQQLMNIYVQRTNHSGISHIKSHGLLWVHMSSNFKTATFGRLHVKLGFKARAQIECS